MKLADPILDSFQPERIYAALVEAGNLWSDANAAADLMEETKKAVLSEIKLNVDEKSDAAKECAALASGRYREHVTAMVAARQQANRARVAYDAAKTLAELRRSEIATRRAELQFVAGGGAG